jgi:UDP-N-acetylglucosamine--N-acetylmuramyl-(pentapeptide) pyrophosphoryl-undecaprenol N-acetylglucosamine transferase
VASSWSAQAWGVHLIHQTGAGQYNHVLESYRQAGVVPRSLDANGSGGPDQVDLALAPFIDPMAPVVHAADLVVCRSGASTLGELAAAGKAALLIPFPEAADNHQLSNARSFERAGAAVVMEQSEMTPESLADRIRHLAMAPEELSRIGHAARSFAKPQAAEAIAQMVLEAAQ